MVRNINALLIEDGSPEELYRELRRAEADLIKINDTNSPVIYHGELTRTRTAAGRVRNLVPLSRFSCYLVKRSFFCD